MVLVRRLPVLALVCAALGQTSVTLVVTNNTGLTLYPDSQQGQPVWMIMAGNSPDALTNRITFAYTPPYTTASITLQNQSYAYYSFAVSTNGGAGSFVAPLTLTSSAGTNAVWQGAYAGNGNLQTTSYNNNQVSQEAMAGLTSSLVQTATNPNDRWIFQRVSVSEDPKTAKLLTSNLWVKGMANYLISIQGTQGIYALGMELRSVPTNDQFTNAPLWVTSTTNQLPEVLQSTAYNTYASMEPQESMAMGGNTVWYQLYPSQGGTFTAQVDPAPYDSIFNVPHLKSISYRLLNPEMSIWSGTNLANLTLIADSKVPNPTTAVTPYTFPTQIQCFMQASNTYYLRIDASDVPGEYTLTRQFAPKAANDNFANAITLVSSAKVYANGIKYLYHTQGANFAATTEAGEPLAHTHSLWYRIVTPADGYLETATSTNTITSFVYVPTASPPSLTTLSLQADKTFYPAGSTVVIVISGDEQIFDLNAELITKPINDYSTNAIVLAQNAPRTTVFPVYNNYATATEPLDSAIPGAMNSIWWAAMPTQSCTLTVRSSTNYPSTFWQVRTPDTPLTPFDTQTNSQSYRLDGKTGYLIKITEPDVHVGDGDITCLLYPNATNDTKDVATPILVYSRKDYANGTVYTYQADGINNGQTQAGEPYANCVWYQWQAPANGYARVQLSSSVANYSLFTLNGMGVSSPVQCLANDNLLLAVGGPVDTYAITVDCRPKPSNDDPANPLPVTLGTDYAMYTTYGSIRTNSPDGAADLWCIYNPIDQMNASFYVAPAVNGKAVILQVYQGGQVLGQKTFTLRNEPALDISFTNQNPATLRLVVQESDTDLDLLIVSQTKNDNFANRELLTLRPFTTTVTTANGSVDQTKFTAHVVANNAMASIEPGEPRYGFSSKDPSALDGKSLWWQVTTPTYGVFSIAIRTESDALHLEVTTNTALPTSYLQFSAWNSAARDDNQIPRDHTITFLAEAGQTYIIRADTVVGGNNRIDFDVSQIPSPSGDFYEGPLSFTSVSTDATTLYQGIYPSRSLRHQYSALGTIYGATRQYINSGLEDFERNLLVSQYPGNNGYYAWQMGWLPLYPAYQTLWLKFEPLATEYLRFQCDATFPHPFAAYTEVNPGMRSANYHLLQTGDVNLFVRGKSYYFLLDALVPPEATFSGNPAFFDKSNGHQSADDPVNIGIQGLNSDIQRDCEDMVAGAIGVTLAATEIPPNDSIHNPATLTLAGGYLGNSCSNPAGSYLARCAQDNTHATSESDPAVTAADQMGGAGKTLWWLITTTMSGPMTIDTSDSQVPVIIKVFPTGNYLGASTLYTTARVTLSAQQGQTFLVGMDSGTGQDGWIAFTASQQTAAPINDYFADAIDIVGSSYCGSLDYSTVEPYENTAGTGSIWYTIRNYATNAQTYALDLTADQARMDLYQNNGGIQSCILKQQNATTISSTAEPAEIDYIRVYSLQEPPSGDIQLNLSASPEWYLGQIQITPSTAFVAKMQVTAEVLSSARPDIYYSTGLTTTNSTRYVGGFDVTETATYDFLVQYPGQALHVTNTYTRLPDLSITPSCTFSNQLDVTAGAGAENYTITYLQGPADGSAPTQTNWLGFPTNGVRLTNSAQMLFKVSHVGNSSVLFRLYIATVIAPTITADGPMLSIQTPTLANLRLTQAGTEVVFPTNQVTVLAMTRTVQATGYRTGWVSSSSTFTFMPVLNTNYGTISVLTNAVDGQSLDFSLINTNRQTLTWCTIRHDGIPTIESSTNATVRLRLNYTFDLEAYAGTAQLDRVGPTTTLHFDAQLLMPQIAQPGDNVVISNPNTLPSTLYVNTVNVGSQSPFSMPVAIGLPISVFAASAWANNSPTNHYTAAFDTNLLVTPTGGIFDDTLTVTVNAAANSQLSVVVRPNEGTPLSYSGFGGVGLNVTLDRSAAVESTAWLYGAAYAQVTNVYTAKVGPVTYQMPNLLDNNTYNAMTPVLLSCPTPGVVYSYKIGTSGWSDLPDNKLLLQAGTKSYSIQASKRGWVTSDPIVQTWAATIPADGLVNYIASDYTIFPGNPTIPALVVATNSTLIDSYPYHYVHYVWLNGMNPAPALYLSNVVTDLMVFHRVDKWQEEDPMNPVVTTGKTIGTPVTVHLFDWRPVQDPGSTNDEQLVVSSDASIYENVYFYRPTWIETWTPMQLVAVGDHVSYKMDPLQNPTNALRYLVPGNLNDTSDRITLRYKTASDSKWNRFTMKFKTLLPTEWKAASGSQVIVKLDKDYANQDVGVYYSTNLAENTTSPFNARVPVTNLLGTLPLATLSNGATNYWRFNSKYHLDGLTNYFPNGKPPLPIYAQ